MPTLAELRASLGEAGNQYTDEQLYTAAKAAFAPLYSDPRTLDRELGYQPERDFMRGLGMAGRNTLAAAGGVVAAGADAVGATGLRDRALEYGRGQQQLAFQQSRRSDDVDNFMEDPLSFLSAGAGQAIGYAVPSLLGGGAGALAGRAVGMGALRGGLAGSYATNVGQQTGGIYNELAEQGLYEPGRALAFGAGTAVLDTIPEALGIGRLAKGVGGLRGAGRGLAVGAGTEAVTEVGQTVGERYAAYKPLDGEEAFKEYRNAAALGALGGGMFGGATGLMGQGAKPPLDDKAPTDLLGQETNTSPPQLGWDGYFQKGESQTPFTVFPDGSTATQADAELMQRYGMRPDDLTALRQGVGPDSLIARADASMAAPGSEGVAPYLPGVMIADQGGQVALDGQNANALYGEVDGDPGLAEARRRYLEMQQQKVELESAKQRVAEKTAARQALEAEAGEFGLKGTRLVDMYGELKTLKDVIPQNEYEDAISALQGNRVPAVRKTIKQYTPQETQGAQPNVPAAPAVAQGAPAGGGAQPAGGGGNLGLLAADGVGRPNVPAGALAPSGTEVAPVGDGAGRRAPALNLQTGLNDQQINEAVTKYFADTGMDPNAMVDVKTAGGKAAKVSRRELMRRMFKADEIDQTLWGAATSAPTGRPLTVDQMALLVQRRHGKTMTKQAIQKRLDKYGITADKVDEATGIAPDTVTEAELGVDEAGSLEGFRTAESLSDATNDALIDDGRTAKQLALDKEAGTLLAKAEPKKQLRDERAVDEFESGLTEEERAQVIASNQLVVARNEALLAQAEAAEKQQLAEEYPRQLRDDARDSWNNNLDDGDVEWAGLDGSEQREFLNLYKQYDTGDITTKDYYEQLAVIADVARQRTANSRPALGRSGGALALGGPGTGARGNESANAGQEAPARAGVGGEPAPGASEPAVEGKAGWAEPLQSGTTRRRPTPNTSASRKTTLEEISGMPGFIAGLKSLADLGIAHATDWVSDWSLGGGAFYQPVGTRQRVGLEPAPSVEKSGQARFDLVHEVGHAVDMVGFGGVYSPQPEMAFSGTGDNIVPTGEIAVEVAQARETAKGTLLADLLAYPYDRAEFGDIVANSSVAQAELFAQLMAIHAHPTLRAMLEIAAPKAARFIKDVVDDIKQTRALQAHTPATATKRREAFAARRNQRGSGVGAPAGNARQAQFASGNSRETVDRLNALEKAYAAAERATPPKVKAAQTNLRDWFKKNAPYLLTNFQLSEQFGDRIKSLAKYTKIADLMRVESTQQQMKFDEVAKRWDKLPTAARELLDKVALRATLQEMHPDLPYDHEDNAHLGKDKRAAHAALAAEYKRMTPETQKVYQDAKATLEQSYDTMSAAVEKLKADYGLDKTLPNKVPGPYFPLLRFGDYLAVGESADFKALSSELATATGKRREELQAEVDAMKRDPKHYVVSAHETRSEMQQAADSYAAQGLEARVTTANQRLDALPKDLHKMVHKMAVAMAKQFDGETANAVVDAYTQMLMKSLPEMHALHRQAARKGVEGASPDMLRAFAAQGRTSAFHTARLLHAKSAADAMTEMKGEVKGDIDLEHVYREMEKRAALNLQFQDTPIQDMAGTMGWMYYLGASPTYLFMQGLQPWLVTGPVLAGKFGFGKASKALSRASMDAMAVLKAARWDGKNWDLWRGISEDSIPGKSVSEERKALRELMSRGIVDEGMQHEMAMFAEGGGRKLARIARGIGWAAQQVELVNRVATALASFRLAREQGMKYDDAVEYAYGTTVNTQMDYSQENTARFMRSGGGIPLAKLLFQFRRYQQAMLYLIGSNITKLSNAQERKTAAGTLAYLTITSGLSAGVMGLPFMGTALLIANAFRDDDNEEGDAETVIRNALFDATGDREMATVLAKGIPALFGADLSQRIGLGGIAQLYPRLEMNGKTGQDNVGKVLTNVAGPVIGGLGSQVFDALAYMRAGDMYKATEKLLPKMAADVLKGSRYWTDGMTDRKGEEILGPEEIGAWNALLRAMGTTSVKEANYYEGTNALRDVQTATKDRKSRIGNQYKAALRDGDMSDVRELIDEYNEDHPNARITAKDELGWRRTARRAAGMRDESGVKFDPKRDKNYSEIMRFAR